jgi:hypothetical protein
MLYHKEVYLFNNYCSCVAMSHIFLMSTPNITFITLEIEIFVCVIPFNLSTLLLLICVIPFNLIILLLLNCHNIFEIKLFFLLNMPTILICVIPFNLIILLLLNCHNIFEIKLVFLLNMPTIDYFHFLLSLYFPYVVMSHIIHISTPNITFIYLEMLICR